MTHSFLPELPDGYSWQLIAEDGHECTGDYYAEPDAVEARIWIENGDLVLCVKRTGDYGFWGTKGLRKWKVEGQPPEGIYDWESFETLSEISRRMKLEEIDV